MTIQNTDLLAVERAGVAFKETAANIKAYVNTGQGTIFHVADIAARDALADLDINDTVHVDDDGDTKWARYQVLTLGPNTFVKITDEDLFNSAGNGANLSKTSTAVDVTIESDTGNDVAIGAATNTVAGVATAAQITALEAATAASTANAAAITATDAVVALNTAARHVAATAGGTATTNPVTVSAGQVVGFSISALAALP